MFKNRLIRTGSGDKPAESGDKLVGNGDKLAGSGDCFSIRKTNIECCL